MQIFRTLVPFPQQLFEDVSLRGTQFTFCSTNRAQFTILLPTACDKKTYCGPPITFLHTPNSIYPVFSD